MSLMQPRRFRAPSGDGGLLAEPPVAHAPALLDRNRTLLGQWDHDFQGRRAGRLRAMARSQLLAASRAHLAQFGIDPGGAGEDDPALPLVVTGHQPELFHPGVWVKNFAASAVARTLGGRGLNLIVDDDLPKAASIRVPVGTERELRTIAVPFDERTGEAPFEDWPVRDEGLFASFYGRVRDALGGRISDPVLDVFWPGVVRASAITDRSGLRFAAARRELEGTWGIANAEVRLGTLCETEPFLWFASHLLAHLPRFQTVHNDALDLYRRLHGIRSRHHPVPGLGGEGEWREAPFWIWRAEAPRRRPLLARQRSRTMELRIPGEDTPFAEIPLNPDREACCAVEQLRELPARGLRLRTRALTTTMFARLLVGDLFIHGIGGAKYDELGDEIVRQFFGVEPPGFLTLSMTLWVGLDEAPVTSEDLRAIGQSIRDLRYNPDRHLAEPAASDLAAIVAAKREALTGPVATRRQRVARFEAIRRLNAALEPAVRDRIAALESRRDQIAAGLRRNAVARGREFAFVLHSQGHFREAVARALPGAFGT